MENLLFGEADSFSVLESRRKNVLLAVDSLSETDLIATSEDELTDQLKKKFLLAVPKLFEDKAEGKVETVKVDVRHDPFRFILDKSKPVYMDDTQISYFIPFEGLSDLFAIRASRFTYNPPRGEVRGNELILRFIKGQFDLEVVKKNYETRLAEIKEHLSWLENDFKGFNDGLTGLISERIGQRKSRIQKNKTIESSLGVPLR